MRGVGGGVVKFFGELNKNVSPPRHPRPRPADDKWLVPYFHRISRECVVIYT